MKTVTVNCVSTRAGADWTVEISELMAESKDAVTSWPSVACLEGPHPILFYQ